MRIHSCVVLSLVGLLCGCASNQPVDNLNGLGPVHHAVSTKNPAAQRAFDEGLARVYGFNHAEAVKAFKQAQELDPDPAMAYWGEALALGPNINVDVDPASEKAAFDAANHAAIHTGNATQAERDLIDAIQKRYSDDPKADLHKLQVDYAHAMGDVSKKYPDDLDIATLWAESMMDLHPWKLWHTDGTPEERTLTVVATLERVLAKNPNHIGANHYYIHAVEASPHPERALPSAERLAALAPKQGHLVHMPAHIYIRTGNYAAANASNRAAIAADDTYISCCKPGPGVYPVMYYNYNIHFLMAGACITNQSKVAIENAARIGENIKPVARQMPMFEPFAAIPYPVYVRFAKWNEILAMPQPDTSMPTAMAARHFARAIAYVAKGDLANAQQEQKEFEAGRAMVAKAELGRNTVEQIFTLASDLLNAKVQVLNGNPSEAIAQLKKAVEIQDQFAYDEPPSWPWSIRETLGGMLLKTNGSVAAEKVFRDDLARHPNSPRALFGLSEALRAQGKQNARIVSDFNTANKDADVKFDVSAL